MTFSRSRHAVLVVLSIAAALSAWPSSPAFAEAPGGRYVVEEGTVTDTRTRLTWQRSPDLTPRGWTLAAPYCSDLDLNGKGWRLPSVKELLTLVDESRWGPAIDPHAAWLLERGMKTLAVRMARHNANGLAVGTFLAGHPRVTSVTYPGLVSHPDHEIAVRTLDGFGGMVGAVIKGGTAGAERVLKRLRLFVHAPSLAGVESLVSEPRITSHKGYSPDALADAGIAEGFVRLSCGIEDAEDLIADLDQALAR